MNRIDEFDALKTLDWSGLYKDVPRSVNDGVQFAFARIRAREKRRRQVVRMLSAAACLCILLGAGAAVLLQGREGTNAPDIVAAPEAQLQTLAGDALVTASMEDPCFHIRSDCARIRGNAVELQLRTALEFEKQLCPECGGDVRLS